MPVDSALWCTEPGPTVEHAEMFTVGHFIRAMANFDWSRLRLNPRLDESTRGLWWLAVAPLQPMEMPTD